jgi:hypothetical protein
MENSNMTEIRKRAFVGIVGLVSAGLFSMGCSSSSSSTDGGAGTTGHAGTSGGTAGTTGSGGATGSAGTTGTGGSSAACTAAPTSGLIADFMGDGGIEIMGGLSAYGGVAAPTHTDANGTFEIMENNPAGAAAQYVGTVLYFSNCVDASAFSGVEFTLSGSVAGCSIQYSTNDVQHDDMSTDPKGGCTLGSACYSPQASITTVPTTATPVMEPFITTAGGNPSAPTDPTKLTGIQWQFTIAPAAEGGAPVSCVSDLKITDVKFYH